MERVPESFSSVLFGGAGGFIYRFGFASEGNEGPVRRRYSNLSKAWKFGNRVNTCISDKEVPKPSKESPVTIHVNHWRVKNP
jgi:hypothetical protein